VDAALRAMAGNVRAAMPCSIELPAGAGKTQIVAGLAAAATERRERPLVLTHTNAGVDALRRRLRSFGAGVVPVDTIASWSFELIQHYPQLSGVHTAHEPDWKQSPEYYSGAAAAAQAHAIRRVMRASYAFVIVDEYQDCSLEQHELVAGLARSLPVCVFGDPLQNIFNFGPNTTVCWTSQVTGTWPAFTIPVKAWRWKGHNEVLGQWLIDVRPSLYTGQPLDLRNAPLSWYPGAIQGASVSACLSCASRDGSIVAIDKWANNCTRVAARTNGAYGIMEELEGKFMQEFAAIVDTGNCQQITEATLKFAKDCLSKIADRLNSAVANKLSKGQSVVTLKRPGAERQLALLSGLLADASPARVLEALGAMAELQGGRLYRREAWRDILQALRIASVSDVTVAQALSRIRNRARTIGRASEQRVISRPLLIKGLEYDHAIVLNAERLTATELYVALSRGRKSLTVVSDQQFLQPGMPSL
jgi:AAA domain